MTENKQQKRLMLLLIVVLVAVAVFICVNCQSKKTSLEKSHHYATDVHNDKDSKNSSKQDSSKVDVKPKENLSNSGNEFSIPKQTTETDHTSDLPQNKNDRDSSEENVSTEVQVE